MRSTHIAPAAGSFQRWAGPFFVLIAIIVGIIGMHGINGASATSLVSGGSAHTAIMVDGMAVEPAPTSTAAALVCATPAGTAALGTPESLYEADCSPAECTYVMAMHGTCIPNVSAPTLNVPLPGTVSIHAPGAAFTLVPGPNAADRSPDPPSLEKLSISRT